MFGHRRVMREGEADVMLIEICKEKDGRWVKYDSCYDTAQLLAPYAEQLGKSEEAARDILEEYMADVVVEFSRLVDGAFLPAQPCDANGPSLGHPLRGRVSSGIAIFRNSKGDRCDTGRSWQQ